MAGIELSPEDRERIYLEEKARLSAQEQLRHEAKGGWGIGCLVIVGIMVLLIALSPKTSTDHASSDKYGRAQHTITLKNTGKKTYRDVVVNVRYHAKTGGYLGHRTETLYEFFVIGKAKSATIEHLAPKNAASSTVSVISAE